MSTTPPSLRFVFTVIGDGPGLEFVEVEDTEGKSVNVGVWSVECGGHHVLTISGVTDEDES